MRRKDYTVSNEQNYLWLRHTGQLWKVGFRLVPSLLGFFGLIASIPLAFVSLWVVWLRWALLCFWIGYLLLYGLQEFLEFYCIKCPRCGYNPTRRKSDKKELPLSLATKRLCEWRGCPECGYEGKV